MNRVTVQLGDRSYPIDIVDGGLAAAGDVLKSLGAGPRVAIVTDSNVGPLYAAAVERSLDAAGFSFETLVIPAGEKSKRVGELERLWNAFVDAGLDRQSVVVALGGGVVGDLAGFAAATYMRGIRIVQVPTTLLACVDSSVGGKTAIDLDAGKNLAGAFHQPSAVLIDPLALGTLPERQLSSGLGEVIKYGASLDAALFTWLDDHMDELMSFDPPALAHAIRRSCEIKAEIVAEDERESSRRAILNFGHTVAHALEASAGFEALLHGEAVSLGMLAEGRVAIALGMVPTLYDEVLFKLLARAGLPISLETADVAAVLEAIRHDKKGHAGKVAMVLPTQIGYSRVVPDVDPALVAKAVESLHGK